MAEAAQAARAAFEAWAYRPLEERIATLEGGLQCVLVPSGLAAIANVALALLKTGDEVLIPDNAYGPNKALAEGELAAFGITHQYYAPMDVADLAARITPKTKLVWLEAAGSVTMEFPDLIAQVRLCRERGVVSALDNTWGAGLAFNAFDLDGAGLGVDISAHALTKYPSGGGDVLMGSVTTHDEALHLKIKLTHMRLGLGVGANDAEAVLRALPSIGLRYRAQDQAARALARWCLTQPQLARVLHPALAGAPGHAHWQQVCGAADARGDGAAAGLFSVMVDARYTPAQVDAFCDALKLFKLGYSWGGPVSLVVPYDLASMRTQWPAHLARGTARRRAMGPVGQGLDGGRGVRGQGLCGGHAASVSRRACTARGTWCSRRGRRACRAAHHVSRGREGSGQARR